MKVAIVGCGLIGQKRANALAGASLVICADSERSRADVLAARWPGCLATTDWRAAVEHEDVNIIIVATPHDSLTPVAEAAIRAGKHVLVEKPGARRVEEIAPLVPLADRQRVHVRVGYNLRYHRAFREMRRIVDAGEIGPLMFLRARYGHGGRPGYDREWRADPHRSGGGELIDQGVHLIDLARWFLGDFVDIQGFAPTYYWDMPVDDNAFMLLRTGDDRAAFLHASCTEWKNTFSFELYGREGKLQVDGLGGSYGVERLSWYKMLPQMGPPPTVIQEFPMADDSWEQEMAEFLDDIRLDRTPSSDLRNAEAVLRVVHHLYRAGSE